MICICATEIDRVLEVISHILDLKEEVMGATVKAWTCNLGPLVANTAMALHGYPKMAYASAIGGPIFSESILPVRCTSLTNDFPMPQLSSCPLAL